MSVQDAECLPRVSAETLWKILDSAHHLHSSLDPYKLPDLLTSGLAELIRYDECSLGIQGLDSVGLVDDRSGSVGIQPPHLCPLPLEGGEGRERRAHGLTMAGRIGGTVGYALVLRRKGGSPPFAPSDARILDLIKPHFEIAMANALALAELARAKELSEKALRFDGKIAVIAAEDGRVLYATDRAVPSLGLAAPAHGLPAEFVPASRLPAWLARVLSPRASRGVRAPGPKRLSSRARGPSPWPSPRRGEGKETGGDPADSPYVQRSGDALQSGGRARDFLPVVRMGGYRRAGIRTRAFHLNGWGSLRLIEIVEDVSHEDLAICLSPREAEIAEAVALGLGNREAAERFGIGVETVRKVLARIYARCGLASRAELAAAVCGGSYAASAGTIGLLSMEDVG